MIEKMKKLTFLVTAKEYEPFLLDLREAGVVHVQELQQGATSPALQEALSLTKRYEDAMQRMENVLKTYEQAGEVPALPSCGSPLELLEHIEALEEEKTRLLHVIDSRKARIEQLTPWGEFSLEELERIEANSKMRIRFFSCPNKLFKKEWEEAYFATPIDEVLARFLSGGDVHDRAVELFCDERFRRLRAEVAEEDDERVAASVFRFFDSFDFCIICIYIIENHILSVYLDCTFYI